MHYLFEQITSVIDVRRDIGVNIIFGAPRCLKFKVEDIFLDELLHFTKLIDEEQIGVPSSSPAIQAASRGEQPAGPAGAELL